MASLFTFCESSIIKVHSHVCFKAIYKLLSEQLASSPLVESDFLATFKLLCSIHVNVPLDHFEFNTFHALWRVIQVDVDNKRAVMFDEVECLSRRVASALTRRGFTKGDTLYFVTFESARLYVILLAVWRLGGITRGWYQRDTAGSFMLRVSRFD
jgi:hypothetical protein